MGEVRVTLATPPPGPSGAAIAVIQLNSGDAAALDAVLSELGIKRVEVDSVAVRRIAGIDTGVVARWGGGCVQVMPHGGAFIVSKILERLRGIDSVVVGGDAAAAGALYPEAGDAIEALMLEALARVASPLAIGVLLRQRDLWREGASRPVCGEDDARRLNYLIEPPTVVLLGPPNIGKSTLTNALASREVSIVSDTAGTTRDHVGVMLDLAGLVVRWIDAPGINAATTDPIEREAMGLALEVARGAELVLACSDAGDAAAGERVLSEFRRSVTGALMPLVVRVGLRGDLAEPGFGACERLLTSVRANSGLWELAVSVRETLVPARLLAGDARWRFHPSLPEH